MKHETFVKRFLLLVATPVVLIVGAVLFVDMQTLLLSPLTAEDAAHIPGVQGNADDLFFAYCDDLGEVDHDIFYHDIGGLAQGIKDADMLVIGNSRALYGFIPEVLQPYGEARGMKIFNASMGFGEGIRFFMHFIKQHDLRHKLLVVDAETFNNDASAQGLRSVNTHPVVALQSVVRKTLLWDLHLLTKKWLDKAIYDESVVWYRSRRTGGLYRTEPAAANAVEQGGDGPDVHLGRADRRRIDDFKRLCRERDLRVVLAFVPYVAKRRAFAELVADYSGWPACYVSGQGLMLWDRVHLVRESGAEFTRRFLRCLDASGHVQAPAATPSTTRAADGS